jgi:hypothetical protein
LTEKENTSRYSINTPWKKVEAAIFASPRRRRFAIAQGILPFQLIADPSKVLITSFGGLSLVMETLFAWASERDRIAALAVSSKEWAMGGREEDLVAADLSL